MARASAPTLARLGRFLPQLTVVAMVLLVLSTALLVARLNPSRGVNLARSAVVTTSSRDGWHPQVTGAVDGNLVDIGFHTQKEDRPWVLLDLRAEQIVSRVVLYNRADCCFDRARPLVIELSRDGSAFTTVARREDEFHMWEARFAPTRVRWIRVQLLRNEFLHLREVEVYR